MSPSQRCRLIDAMENILPLPADCDECDPHGGCPAPNACRRDLAADVLAVIEREGGTLDR
jgi:hypothetical protein